MSLDIRPINRDELTAFMEADSYAFGYTPEAGDEEKVSDVMEFDRTLAVFDGKTIVGTTCIFSYEMTVPGGALPTAGVSWVSVLPTHRRRGILTAMMRRQLEDVRARGEALAALWASESLIYGRFGYGLAAESARLEIEQSRTKFEFAPDWRGRVRLVSADEALERWPACYDRARYAIPGMLSRHQGWWRRRITGRSGSSASERHYYAQYEDNGEIRGFARYRIKEQDGPTGLPENRLTLQELQAETMAAYTALWQLVLHTDLVKDISAPLRRVHEPLYHMLADNRRLTRNVADSLWVRVVDPVKALEGRRYQVEGALTIAVHDDFCPWVGSKYRLEGGPDGARCQKTTGPADLSMTARELGAIYMGGTRLSTLAAAGRIEGHEKALHLADLMFSWPEEPWCPEVF